MKNAQKNYASPTLIRGPKLAAATAADSQLSGVPN